MEQIQPPYRCFLWGADPGPGPVRFALVGRETGGGAAEPVVLRAFPGGRVLLAALVDREWRVVERLELWVQESRDLAGSPLARCGLLSNALADQRWRRIAEVLRALDEDRVVATGWETADPGALGLDLERGAVVRLVHGKTGRPLELCRDDAALTAAGLTPYSTSLDRWFRVKGPTGDASWYSASDVEGRDGGEPVATAETAREAAVGRFNAGAGAMLVCRHAPVGLEAFLRGIDPPGAAPVATGAGDGPAAELEAAALRQWAGTGFRGLLAGENGAFEEAFLRLHLWWRIVREVHRASARQGAPFFNLSTDSIGLRSSGIDGLVPAGWALEPVLVKPGAALPLRLGGVDLGFAPLGDPVTGPFFPTGMAGWLEGSGTTRLRQLAEAEGGLFRLEGTVEAAELKNAAAGTHVWIQLVGDGRPVAFLAACETERNVGRSGVHFATVGVELPAGAIARLRATLNSRVPCRFVLLQPVNPLFDVYSLGVVGVRILLESQLEALPETVDDLCELGGLLPPEATLADLVALAKGTAVGARLQRILSPPAWATRGPADPGLPRELWCAILRELIECVAFEDPGPEGAPAPGGGPGWLGALAGRLAAIEQLTRTARDLAVAPRPHFEEIARVVNSFA